MDVGVCKKEGVLTRYTAACTSSLLDYLTTALLHCYTTTLSPATVGKRGSSHPSARPSSMSHCSLRFERRVFTKLMREKPQSST